MKIDYKNKVGRNVDPFPTAASLANWSTRVLTLTLHVPGYNLSPSLLSWCYKSWSSVFQWRLTDPQKKVCRMDGESAQSEEEGSPFPPFPFDITALTRLCSYLSVSQLDLKEKISKITFQKQKKNVNTLKHTWGESFCELQTSNH